MGRYYYGDIEGKFAFGVQNTDAMDKFGAVSVEGIKYQYCGCDYIENVNYCQECYDSKEEHAKVLIENYDYCPYEGVEERFTEDGMLHSEMTKEAFEEYGLPFLRKHEELYKKGQANENDVADDEEEIYYDMEMLMEIKTFFEKNKSTVCRWKGELL